MDAQLMPVSQNSFMLFVFEGMALKESCWMDGKPYFTRKAIGEFLEYPHPKQAIGTILKRNPHIRDTRWSTVLKLRTVQETGKEEKDVLTHQIDELPKSQYERELEVEVFDPIGLQLIIFESNQPKAKLYKIAAAHLVYAFMTGDLKPSKWSQRGDLVSAARQILSLPEGRKRGQMIVDLAEREGLSVQQMYRRITMVTGERLKGKTGKPRKSRSTKGSHKTRPEYIQVINYIKTHPTAKGAEIKKVLNPPVSTPRVNAWLRELRGTVH